MSEQNTDQRKEAEKIIQEEFDNRFPNGWPSGDGIEWFIEKLIEKESENIALKKSLAEYDEIQQSEMEQFIIDLGIDPSDQDSSDWILRRNAYLQSLLFTLQKAFNDVMNKFAPVIVEGGNYNGYLYAAMSHEEFTQWKELAEL